MMQNQRPPEPVVKVEVNKFLIVKKPLEVIDEIVIDETSVYDWIVDIDLITSVAKEGWKVLYVWFTLGLSIKKVC